MATRFIPCPACARHVRQGDEACPFCGATPSPAPALRLPSARLSRAALLALGAAGALAATDCSSSSAVVPAPFDAGASEDGGSPASDSAAPAPDAGGAPDGGGFAQPLYGAMVIPADAAGGEDAEGTRDGGFAQPLYGAMAPPHSGV
jgi:hypothetical protein